MHKDTGRRDGVRIGPSATARGYAWTPIHPVRFRRFPVATTKLAAALKLAEERNLRFVSLQFTDIVGQVKSVQVPMHQLEEAVEHGKWFDGSSIEGFARIAESDMFLVPDLDTFSADPVGARASGRTARRSCTPAARASSATCTRRTAIRSPAIRAAS